VVVLRVGEPRNESSGVNRSISSVVDNWLVALAAASAEVYAGPSSSSFASIMAELRLWP
jgi:hypothetical protein